MKPCTAFLALALLAAPAFPQPADDAARLHALFDREWEVRLKEDPLFATAVGRHEYNALLPSITLADLERRARAAQATLGELAAIDRAKLGAGDVVNYDMFRRQLENRIKDFELG
ncbi:MAG TPA: DUF885 family protein, partial [Thermoanaerobaculia bacterium]